MKRTIFIILTIAYVNTFGQDFDKHSKAIIQKAILENDRFYVGGLIMEENDEDDWSHLISYYPYFKSYNLVKKQSSELIIQGLNAFAVNKNDINYFFPYCWDICDTLWFSLTSSGGSFTYGTNFRFYRDLLKKPEQAIVIGGYDEQKFSETYPKIFENSVIFSPFFLKSYYKNFRTIEPLKQLYNVLLFSKEKKSLPEATFNFMPVSNDSILFYVRVQNQLTIWSYYYPSPGIKSSQSNWKEVKTYLADTIGLKVPRNILRLKLAEMDFLPSDEKQIFNSIKDSFFFDGHYDVVKQHEIVYIINLKHGNIYFLSNKRIENVGKIDLDEYVLEFKGKKIFIEDRDNNQLIFFAPVEWMRDDLPKPNVRIITDEKEFKEMFKYVLE